MLLPVEHLQAVMTQLPAEKAALYAPLLSTWCEHFEINTPRRLAMFLATLAEESGELQHWRENMNYSTERLMQVWPSRFPNAARASQYARNPTKLANYIYGELKGKELGNRPNSNDGWLFRGGGPGQATGRAMYAALTAAFEDTLAVDLVRESHRIEEPEVGIATTCWIWSKDKNLNPIADSTTDVSIKVKGRWLNLPPFSAVTQKWNGGQTNLQKRLGYLKRAGEALGVKVP